MRASATLLSLFTAWVSAAPFAEPQTPTAELNPPQATSPPADKVSIQNVTWAGSGCPPGSVAWQISGDASIINLSFSNYIAEFGAGKSVSDWRKNCNVDIKLHFPQGWSYTVATTDFRGYVLLENTCTASLGGQYWFSGQQKTASTTLTLPGPQIDNYQKTVAVGADALVWSECGAEGPLFNINSQASVFCTNNTEAGLLTVDTQDTKFTVELLLQWKKCG